MPSRGARTPDNIRSAGLDPKRTPTRGALERPIPDPKLPRNNAAQFLMRRIAVAT
jgi:hypothetical protein